MVFSLTFEECCWMQLFQCTRSIWNSHTTTSSHRYTTRCNKLSKNRSEQKITSSILIPVYKLILAKFGRIYPIVSDGCRMRSIGSSSEAPQLFILKEVECRKLFEGIPNELKSNNWLNGFSLCRMKTQPIKRSKSFPSFESELKSMFISSSSNFWV